MKLMIWLAFWCTCIVTLLSPNMNEWYQPICYFLALMCVGTAITLGLLVIHILKHGMKPDWLTVKQWLEL